MLIESTNIMRTIFMLLLLAAVAVVAYNYGAGRGFVFQLPATSSGVDDAGTDIRDRVAAGANTAVSRTEEAVAEAALTSKIKAKMALDDLVKAANIDVDTSRHIVTLTGDVASAEERRRAVRLAKETAGVTEVVDHLRIRK
jgi:hyperosmotically inducible protein